VSQARTKEVAIETNFLSTLIFIAYRKKPNNIISGSAATIYSSYNQIAPKVTLKNPATDSQKLITMHPNIRRF